MKGVITYIHRKGEVINMYIRGEDRKRHHIRILDFKPYFYFEDENGQYKSIFGEKLAKKVVNSIDSLKEQRKIIELIAKGKTYESDVPFIQRFLIDKEIYGFVEFPEGRTDLFTNDIEAIHNHLDIKPRIWYFDIEVHAPDSFPEPDNPVQMVNAFTIYDSYLNKYTTVVVDRNIMEDDMKQEDNRTTVRVMTEDELLFLFIKLFNAYEPDIITGWNIDFDIDYILARLKYLGYETDFFKVDTFDMLEAYKQLFRLKNNRLKYVAVQEGIISESDVVAGKDLPNLWKEDIDTFIEYNWRDVYILVKLDEMKKIIDFYWNVKLLSGVTSMRKTVITVVNVDVLLLRLAKKLGVVLPKKRDKGSYSKYEGAIVLDPPKGVYENVADFDMSRYYPSILISFNLSPEVNGIHDKKGILPMLAEQLLQERERIENEMKQYDPNSKTWEIYEMKIMVIKYAVNAIYGYLAYQHSRLFDLNLASSITRYAREGILAAKRIAESEGYRVLYGDTDSIFIQVPFIKTGELLEKLNKGIKSYFIDTYKLKDIRIKLKFEKYIKRILFTGAKKRYAAWVVWDKGKEANKIDVKGFESIRTDQAEFTKELQETLFKMILIEGKSVDEIKKYLDELIENFAEQDISKIAIMKSITKPFKEYKTMPPHIKGAMYANMYLGDNAKPGDKVYMIYVKYVEGINRKIDVIAVTDLSLLEGRKVVIDTERMFEVVLKKKVENILKAFDIELTNKKVSSKKRMSLNNFFGGD